MLIVDLDVVAERAAELRKQFRQEFVPAIVRQRGFRQVALYEARDAGAWSLFIEFESEESRLDWVESALHQKVWRKVERCCKGIQIRMMSLVDGRTS